MTTQEEHERDLARVEQAVAGLGEFFDSVQVFVSKHTNPGEDEDQATFTAHRGCGNWCTRYGQVREWLLYEDERIRASARHDTEDE